MGLLKRCIAGFPVVLAAMCSIAAAQSAVTVSPPALEYAVEAEGAPADNTVTMTNVSGQTQTITIQPRRTAVQAAAIAQVAATPDYAKIDAAIASGKAEFALDRVIIVYKEGRNALASSSTSSRAGVKSMRDLNRARLPGSGMRPMRTRRFALAQLQTRTREGIVLAIEELKRDPSVLYVQPDFKVSVDMTPNDPRFIDQYYLHNVGQTGGTIDADIDAPEAWEEQRFAHDVVVGIFDTGIDYLHPDLADNIWTNPGEIPDNGIDDDNNGYVDDIHGWDFVNNDNDPMDDNFHGTHVAGIVAAAGDNSIGVCGVAWHAKLMACKFLGYNGSGNT